MAISFNCVACGQALVAQAIFAGMETTCPVCKAKNTIPKPVLEEPSATEMPVDPYLIDMETYKDPPPPDSGGAS